MQVGELGEFALIDRLQRRVQGVSTAQVVRGIGDDCAVLRLATHADLLVTTDTQEEEVHFRRAWSTPEDIGWRCLAVNLSDIAAMAGTPLGAVIALSLPAHTPVDFVEALYDGLYEAATAYQCPILGGNMSKTTNNVSVTITVLGEAAQGQSVERSGAQVGDDIWVTGPLGSAKAGLEALLHPEAIAHVPTSEVLTRYRRPLPRLAEAQYLQQHVPLHSLIDLSDGIAGDLAHICEQSGVGAQLEAACLPITQEVRQVASALQRDPLTFALHGGEDFELCFTAPATSLSQALQEAFTSQFHGALVRVGTMLSEPGLTLCYPDGTRQPLRPHGYDHFRSHSGAATKPQST